MPTFVGRWGIPRGSVVDLEFKSGGLFAEFGVRHAPSLRKRDVDKRLARCEFCKTWELYEPRNLMMIKDEPVGGGVADGVVAPEDSVVTHHRVQFDGDDWDAVLERKRAALCEAFDADVCGAVGIPRGSVADVEFTLGSLSVAFGVRHAPSLSKRDVDKRLANATLMRYGGCMTGGMKISKRETLWVTQCLVLGHRRSCLF
ncbi:hypothetical protein C3747_223g36 [Trypanosoma cruzi]|uniref:Flagellar attachment zone protein 1 conserved domain-containing protein n=1 Tax=Trypanosoma cruzi TaxID=5693 RepID=A0A2V2VX33_TRYCR|nr:hypothetical protein C3747_223g36 [Trypanosoma cruzi]